MSRVSRTMILRPSSVSNAARAANRIAVSMWRFGTNARLNGRPGRIRPEGPPRGRRHHPRLHGRRFGRTRQATGPGRADRSCAAPATSFASHPSTGSGARLRSCSRSSRASRSAALTWPAPKRTSTLIRRRRAGLPRLRSDRALRATADRGTHPGRHQGGQEARQEAGTSAAPRREGFRGGEARQGRNDARPGRKAAEHRQGSACASSRSRCLSAGTSPFFCGIACTLAAMSRQSGCRHSRNPKNVGQIAMLSCAAPALH